MMRLNLSYYVGIDYAARIEPDEKDVFMHPENMNTLLNSVYQGRPDRFWNTVYVYPGTYVEELFGANFDCWSASSHLLSDRHYKLSQN